MHNCNKDYFKYETESVTKGIELKCRTVNNNVLPSIVQGQKEIVYGIFLLL